MPGLSGMKDICRYTNRSESTVLDWIRHCEFPASRINGGMWESSTGLIDLWRDDQILTQIGLKRKEKTGVKPNDVTKAKKKTWFGP